MGTGGSSSSSQPIMKLFESPVAGSWYPGNADALRTELGRYLGEVDSAIPGGQKGRIAALVSPHAGYRFSGGVAAHGFKALEGSGARRVIVIGPSHHVAFAGVALPDFTHYRTPLGDAVVDVQAVESLAGEPGFAVRPDAFAREHSLDMQIPFLQTVLPDARIVPLVVGRVSPEVARQAGQALRRMLDATTIIVASSDFTHYGERFGYVPFTQDVQAGLARMADEAAAQIGTMSPDDFRQHVADTGDTICGAGPIQILLAALPLSAEMVRLKYDNSGRMTGDWVNAVSYLSLAFVLPQGPSDFQGVHFLDESEQRYLVALARETIRCHLRGDDLPIPGAGGRVIPESVKKPYGVFVTLKKRGALRGCIGSIMPSEPLVDGVIRNAVNAAVQDPRFPPLSRDEEPDVEIEISVLTPPQDVQGPDDIRVGRDGVILASGNARSVFLPQVAPEQGWDRDTMLTHLARKAGLSGDSWRNGTSFQVFQAQVFEESHLAGSPPSKGEAGH